MRWKRILFSPQPLWYNYQREEVFKTKAVWKPTFEPDASMLSSIGDGIIKINQAIPGAIDEYRLKRMTGIE